MKCDFSGFCSVRNCTKWLLTLKVADPRPKRPRLHPLNSIHQQWRRRLLHPLQKHGGNLQVFALRTLVWEGMGLSCSLHPDLSGFGWNGNICSLLSLRTFILKDPHQKWRCWSFRKRTVCGQSGDCQRGRSYRTGRVCRVNSDLWCRFSARFGHVRRARAPVLLSNFELQCDYGEVVLAPLVRPRGRDRDPGGSAVQVHDRTGETRSGCVSLSRCTCRPEMTTCSLSLFKPNCYEVSSEGFGLKGIFITWIFEKCVGPDVIRLWIGVLQMTWCEFNALLTEILLNFYSVRKTNFFKPLIWFQKPH